VRNLLCGIDLGSRAVKVVFMDAGQVAAYHFFDTVEFYRKHGRKHRDVLQVDFEQLGLPKADFTVATGYGRNTLGLEGAEVIPELKAHMLGAVYQTGLQDFTLLDLGGQDSKVIKVRKGRMVDFQTNDKCAASTGRYLENMATVLGITLDELSQYSEQPVELNSTCAIFGESELIGKIVEGHSVASLAAGVNYSIFKRIRAMLNSLQSDVLVFTGGVARSHALQDIIRRETKFQVVVPEHPQINGAIGCCVHAQKSGIRCEV
jgi:(R)-2-hydroxyacyl-CoA dehydratese activating ATPase